MRRLGVLFFATALWLSGIDAQEALKKAAQFYRQQVSTEGGYHFSYATDLSYGRSESAEGPTQVSVQRAGTPIVGMAFLDAWEATGDRFYLDAARDAALALVRGQLCSGGWHYVIEFDQSKRSSFAYRADGNCGGEAFNTTTLDDNVTQAAVRLLMRVDRELELKNAKIHEAAEFALRSLMRAQYPNGAWPQRFSEFPDPSGFPVKRASYPESWSWEYPGADYRKHYTFNDNTISDVIDMFLEAARIYDKPEYLEAAEKGGGFILLAQMPDPQPAWAQQYDLDMHPAWARRFEPPSVTGGESQGILETLMVLYRETGKKKYLEPVPRVLEYLKRSTVPESDSEIYRRAARAGGPVLARFYELRTNRPLYVTKGTQIRVKGSSTARIDGYELSYSDASVITHYGVLTSGGRLAGIERAYGRLAAADPQTLRRPGKLRGLSPWSERPARPLSSGDIQRIVDGMDSRGAWVEEGTIGKADRLVSVFAARDMVVKVSGKTLPITENDTVEIYQGAEPPREKIIRSETFARNVRALSRSIAMAKNWRSVAGRLIETPPRNYPFNWGEGVQMIGLMRVHERTGDERYADYVERWTDLYLGRDLEELLHSRNRRGYCGHWSPGTAILLLHGARGNPQHLDLAKKVNRFILDEAERSPEGGLGHWQGSHQYWVDTLYMACPLLAGIGEPAMIDDAANQIAVFARHLQDDGSGLFLHMWDWETKERSAGLWGRGNGWVLMSIADTMEAMDRNHPAYTQLQEIARKMASGLEKTQSGSGLWHTILDRQDSSYSEVSATCMFVYGILKLVRLGVLPDSYAPMAERAWSAVNDGFVRDGLVVGVSAGTGPRGAEHYRTRDRGTYTWGTGAYLMAGSEIDRLGAK